MYLLELGYSDFFAKYHQEHFAHFHVARVIAEHRERYTVKNEQGEYDAELIGSLRYLAENKSDFPCVGDWVAISELDEAKALIHGMFPRVTQLERQQVGKYGEKQLIASNIDVALIVQSINRDFTLNRLERYLTLCYAGKIQPVILLSKIDLIDSDTRSTCIEMVKNRITDVPVLPFSAVNNQGIDEIEKLMQKGKTYCLLGSSGVGKSSLINAISGQNIMKTGEISAQIDRGKHITTHRELLVLPNHAIIIDNPGMREVGISDVHEGLSTTFDYIENLSQHCKFRNCTHTNETGCAILHAIQLGELSQDAFDNFKKLEREQAHFTATVKEKREKDRKFGKMYKEVMRFKKQSKNR